jgi:hypothetical protein
MYFRSSYNFLEIFKETKIQKGLPGPSGRFRPKTIASADRRPVVRGRPQGHGGPHRLAQPNVNAGMASSAGGTLARRPAAVTTSRATTMARWPVAKGEARGSSDGGSSVSGVRGARQATSRQRGLTVVVAR